MTKKNKFIVALSTCAVSCLALAFTFMPKTEASAAIDVATVNTIAMQNGASVRLKKSSPQAGDVTAELTGIRFTMFLNKDYYDSLIVVEQSETVLPEVGMYIAIADTVEEGANLCTEEAFTNATYRFVKAQAFAGDSDLTTDETISLNVVLYDIPVSAYNVPLVANGYIVDGNGNKVFATNPITRSVAQVASMELADGGTGAGLTDYVDNVVTADNFKLANTDIVTDLYKTETSIDLGVTLPERLTAIWESSDPDVAAVDASGNVTRGSKVGETTITATLGTVTRTAKITVNAEPAPVIVTSTHYTNITNPERDLQPIFMTEAEWKAAGVTGDYTGNASVMNQSANNPRYRIINQYTDAELDAIAEEYNTVSLWIATSVPSGFIGYYHLEDGSKTFVTSVCGEGNSKTLLGGEKVFKKLSVTLNDYRAMLQTDEQGVSYCPLLRTYQESSAGGLMYVGNVVFEYVEPTIVTVSSTTYSNIYLRGNKEASSYIAAGEDSEIAGFAGGYTGNATKLARYTSINYAVVNPYSLEELAKINEKYDSVSLWVAHSAITSGATYFYEEGAKVNSSIMPASFFSKAGYESKRFVATYDATNAAHLACETWYKISITIEDYIALVTTTDADSGESVATADCTLFGRWDYNYDSASIANAAIYIGDIFFE